MAESGDVDEHDFLALDWTTLAPDCDPAAHQVPDGLPIPSLMKKWRGRWGGLR
jgi:hypothetical protein